MARRFGDVVQYRTRGRTFLQVTHPDAVHELLVEKVDQFRESFRAQTALAGATVNFPGDNVAGRSLVAPSLEPDELQAFCHSLSELARSKIRFGHVRIFNIREVVADVALITVAESLLGPSIGYYTDLLRAALPASIVWKPRQRWFANPWTTRGRDARIQLKSLVGEWIDQRRQAVPESNWLSRFVTAIHSYTPQPLDTPRLSEFVLALWRKVHDAMTDVLTWAAYLLAKHPAVQNEVASFLDSAGTDAVLASQWPMPPSPIVDLVNETLRLHPVTPILAREASDDSELFGFHVPRRAICVVPIYLMQRDPRWFESPDEFRIDRIPRGEKLDLARKAFLPFGCVSQACVVQQFAMLGGVVMLSTILRSNLILPVEGFPPEPLPTPYERWRADQGPFVQLRHRR